MFIDGKKNCPEKNCNFFISDRFLWLIISFGVILYFRQYLYNRSLWFDEAMLSLDIIRTPMSAFLHQPLYDLQIAPVGFLVIEKVLISLFGTSEYALRLFPFLTGLLSLWLFFRLARTYFTAFALFIFVVTPSLVYYSSEVKQYGIDVFCVLLAYLAIAGPCLKQLDWNTARNAGLLGAFMIWFSFPIIFVLLGMILAFLSMSLIQKDRSQSIKLGVIFICWLVSYALNYVLLLNNFSQIKHTGNFWQTGFISFTDYGSWFRFFKDAFLYPVGAFDNSKITGAFFLLGGYSFFKQDKRIFLILIVPLLIVFFVCGLHLYSGKGRLILFLAPSMLLLILKGIETISLKTGRWRIIVALLLTAVTFYNSIRFTTREFLQPKGNEEIRTVISYVKQNLKPEDLVYVYYGAVPGFKYYNFDRGFFFRDYINEEWAEGQPARLIGDLKGLRGFKRAWMLFSHLSHTQIKGMSDEDYILHYVAGSGGKALDHFSSKEAEVFLFDLGDFRMSNNPDKGIPM